MCCASASERYQSVLWQLRPCLLGERFRGRVNRWETCPVLLPPACTGLSVLYPKALLSPSVASVASGCCWVWCLQLACSVPSTTLASPLCTFILRALGPCTPTGLGLEEGRRDGGLEAQAGGKSTRYGTLHWRVRGREGEFPLGGWGRASWRSKSA